MVVGVGSNLDPETNVPRAVRMLAAHARIVAASAFYRSPPLDRPEQPDFANGALLVETILSPGRFKPEVLRRIEASLGRVRGEDPHAARTIDLDVVAQREGEAWRVVEEDAGARAFVAVPASEVAPGLFGTGGPPSPSGRGDLRVDEALTRAVRRALERS